MPENCEPENVTACPDKLVTVCAELLTIPALYGTDDHTICAELVTHPGYCAELLTVPPGKSGWTCVEDDTTPLNLLVIEL